MPGPAPKPIEMRQRQNKAATRTTLVVDSYREKQVPDLPPFPKEDNDWEPLALRWWEDVWTSPMAAEFLDSDFHTLLRLVFLVDKFWKKPSVSLAAEIRMLERDFGFSPLNRRRLEWQVVQNEDAKQKHYGRQSRQAVQIEGDPRSALS